MSSALRLRRLDALHALTGRLAGESGGGVLGDCLDLLLDATPARCALAFSADGAVEPAAERRLSRRPELDPGRLRRGARALAERAATARRLVQVNDVRREVETLEDASEIAALGVRAVLAHPIMHRRTVLATLVLMFDDAAMLDEETLRYLTTVCSVAAVALERDRQLEEARTDRDRLVAGGANAGVGLVTATVAHELKSPAGALAMQHDELRRVVEQLEMLAGPSDTALGGGVAELAELTGDMGVAIARINETVEKLTSVGRRERPLTRLDVGAVAREAMVVARPHLEKLGVTLNERYDSDCFTLGRADTLSQVVLNLVFNAADACSGGSRPQVWLRTAVDGPHVLLMVQDNGPGVPPDAVEHIFTPFYPTKNRGVSAGLGLKICSDVVADHGGHIEVHERAGGGAAFHVLLPRVDGDGQASLSETPLPPSAQRPGERRILVIDDDPVLSRTLRRGLKPHDVRTASSASEAEILLLDPTFSPDLVVCDVFLPGANGHVLHERLRAARPHVADRFVFVTGGALGRAEADYIKLSGRPTLLKPVDVKSILALLAPSATHDSTPPNSVRTLSEAGSSERPTLSPPEPPGPETGTLPSPDIEPETQPKPPR
jgi:signal transduction histidine kinase/ActR/RegA family two-component response regulator